MFCTAREGQVSVQGSGSGVLVPACCEGRASPGMAQLKPETGPGTTTPVVTLTSTAKTLESTTKHNWSLSVASPTDWSYRHRRGCSRRTKEVSGDSVCPEDSGTWSSVTSNKTASLGCFSSLILPSNYLVQKTEQNPLRVKKIGCFFFFFF